MPRSAYARRHTDGRESATVDRSVMRIADTRSRRRSNTSERFVAYSRAVLEGLKRDIANGQGVDPKVVEDLERTIKRHEPSGAASKADPKDRIEMIHSYGRGER